MAIGRPFQKGQSGNPGGRAKAIVEVAAAAREHTIESINTLVEISRNTKATDSARVSAAVALLDRAWGKAPAVVTLHDNRKLEDLTDAALIAIACGLTAEDSTADRGADPAAPPVDPSKLN
jgi:hypothetical protein